MLFDAKERTAQDFKSHIETDWDYLDRSGRVEAKLVREFLNHWVSVYPDEDRPELISRIRGGDDRALQSAVFEIVLFALLRSIGCSVTVHPELPGGTLKRPDFLAVTPKDQPIYVEAVLASEHSQADVAARKRTDAVLNAIEKVDSPNFFLLVKATGHPERPPNGKVLRGKLRDWLSSLDPDDVAREMRESGNSVSPRITVELDDWVIVFDAIPKKAERRGKGQRVIGALSSGVGWSNVWEPIRDAVKAKGNRYGKLPHPLLVAVNVDAPSVERSDEMQGLFGEEEYVFDSSDLSAAPQIRQKPNGVWRGPEGPQYKRVSGAWIFSNLSAWNMVSRVNTVYWNPWASKTLPSLFTIASHAKLEGEKMQWNEGQSVGDILGLHAQWPEDPVSLGDTKGSGK